jgi:hypothetical protein
MGIFTVPKEDIDRCIALLGGIGAGQDGSRVLNQIQPTILRLRNGKLVFAQLQKLVMAGNAERAVKLLRAAPRSRAGVFRLGGVLGPILTAVLVLVGVPMMPRCDGAYEPAFAALNACPQAVALLGGNIRQSSIGMACGSSETSGSYGRANWKIPVTGDRGSGSFQYAGRNNGQGWRLDYASLEVGDQVVSVWPCGAATTEALNMAVSMTGTVTSVQGAAAAQPNTPCTVTISPTPDAARQQGLNCHVRVQCGNAIIYGWEGAGYTSCQITAGRAMRADDRQGASVGDDPMIALDVANRTCQVWDDGGSAFNLLITLTGGV